MGLVGFSSKPPNKRMQPPAGGSRCAGFAPAPAPAAADARRWAVMNRSLLMANVTSRRSRDVRRTVSRLSRIFIPACTSTVFLACALATGRSASAVAPTSIELWCRGDDGLTLRFRDAIESAFRGTSGFTLAVGNEARTPRTLVVTIVDHLSWEHVGEKTQVSYTIAFEGPNAQSLGTSAGSCWEDEMSSCVRRAVNATKRAAKRIG